MNSFIQEGEREMFGLLIFVSFIVVIIGVLIISISRGGGIIGGIVMILLAIGIFVYAWTTPQGTVYWQQFTATAQTGNWLVVDNSGGETLRHWILEDGFVGPVDGSDGWKFDSASGIAYVGGDTFVLRISEPLASFEEHYRTSYGIPQQQIALH